MLISITNDIEKIIIKQDCVRFSDTNVIHLTIIAFDSLTKLQR